MSVIGMNAIKSLASGLSKVVSGLSVDTTKSLGTVTSTLANQTDVLLDIQKSNVDMFDKLIGRVASCMQDSLALVNSIEPTVTDAEQRAYKTLAQAIFANVAETVKKGDTANSGGSSKYEPKKSLQECKTYKDIAKLVVSGGATVKDVMNYFAEKGYPVEKFEKFEKAYLKEKGKTDDKWLEKGKAAYSKCLDKAEKEKKKEEKKKKQAELKANLPKDVSSCKTLEDFALYARNNEGGLAECKKYFLESGKSEAEFAALLDKYYSTDKYGNSKDNSTAAGEGKDWKEKWVDSYAKDLKAAQGPNGEFSNLSNFAPNSSISGAGRTRVNGVSCVSGTSEDVQEYLYNLCQDTGMDYPLLLAMWCYEASGYASTSASGWTGKKSGGLFGFTGCGTNYSGYSTANYTVSGSTVTSNMNEALQETFGTTDVVGTTYGNIYHDAAYAIEVVNAKVSERGSLAAGMTSYCGGANSAAKRFNLANQIRAELGWEQVDYYAM